MLNMPLESAYFLLGFVLGAISIAFILSGIYIIYSNKVNRPNRCDNMINVDREYLSYLISKSQADAVTDVKDVAVIHDLSGRANDLTQEKPENRPTLRRSRGKHNRCAKCNSVLRKRDIVDVSITDKNTTITYKCPKCISYAICT